ncbi:hypothetical protein [Intestinirhabdus alba]|uniref:hypothetical protein n=1 Tax=Intestinirhabdus alba TaxID=2899544 RepID=UPI001E5D82CB|nr:hypothetical protein [Intestinirhabdus alba]
MYEIFKKTALLPAILIAVAVSLSGCNATSAKKKVRNTPSPAAVQGATAAKTESRQCTDNFDLLKKLNPTAFTLYRSQFDAINASYSYYNENRELMEKDPQEVMTLTLNDKLNLICDRVKSQTFIEIRNRMNTISKI